MAAASLHWLYIAAAALLVLHAAADDSASYPPPQDSGSAAANGVRTQYPWPQQPANLQPPEEGYRVQTGYEGYLVPTLVAPPPGAAYPPSELLPLLSGVSAAWAGATWLVSHAAALALGSLLAVGVCKLTPLCSGGWLGTHVEHLRGFAEPGRLARAADVLAAAIRKYGSGAETSTAAGEAAELTTETNKPEQQ